MPGRKDIKKVMIIGSGPIVIGQACEFDYSGTQACKALRKLGYEIVLVNSNPATIMTDPGMADVTYIEPLNLKTMIKIIEKERPDALLPNLGGQSALNLSSELFRAGVLDKYGVQIIGVQADAIERGEDRIAFKETMNRLGIEMPKSDPAFSVEEAEKIADELGYPVVIRPAYTMGGTGGGLVYNVEELRVIASRGIAASLVGQILVEESVLGWEELELEVVRDAKNQMITVCFIENVDAMGVHTGDSYCTAPMLTIDPELQKKLQKHSYDIVEAIQVIGGTNIQFAHDPKTGRVVVIEINPQNVAVIRAGFQGHGISHSLDLGNVGRRLDFGRNPLLARGHAGKVHSLGRLCCSEVCPVGLREVCQLRRQTGHANACCRGGDEHRQELQRSLSEVYPFPGNKPVRIGLCQGFPSEIPGRSSGPFGRAVQRTTVHHVRGPA